MPTAYNPSDPVQAKFLGALQKGESGGDYNIGVGWNGVPAKDLSGYPTDSNGFPQWNGVSTSKGPSHAAGAYQFQPGTWKSVADKYGLNFQNKTDQDAGAWYHAQDVYKAQTGGDLETDLAGGMFAKVASSLKSTWTSITASGLKDGVAAELSPGSTSSGGSTPSLWTNPAGAITTYFVRGSMILIGGIILAIALWAILTRANVTEAKFA